MEKKEKTNINIFKNTVERNRAATSLCKALFPLWDKPPLQGELQRIVIKGWAEGARDIDIKKAGEWWLWFRTIVIENTFTKGARELSMDFAIRAAIGINPVEIITTRSPELLHAQVEGQADKALPRSRKALTKLRDLIIESSRHLPTKGVVILADLAVDNFDAIRQRCNPKEVVEDNLTQLSIIAGEVGLEDLKIIKMSELNHPKGVLGSLVDMSGESKIKFQLSTRSTQLIDIATRESSDSHKRMFGWNFEVSRGHNSKLGVTMGMVGESIKSQFNSPLLIHNEAFIARGQLNNIFLPEKDPLPVICLTDLLERKGSKD